MPFFFCPAALSQSIIYVDQSASGSGDGSSWSDAFIYLQDALAAAQSGDEVWVAAGIYRPDQGSTVTLGDREAYFEIPGDVSLFGGFGGSELSLSGRNWTNNEAILSGDLLENDNDVMSFSNPLRFDNSYHIIRLRGRTGPIRIDGFTIRDGMANADGGFAGGSAIQIGNPAVDVQEFPFFRISNCLFYRNAALTGSIRISADPTEFEPTVVIEDSRFLNNLGNASAGVDASDGTTLIRNVQFVNNEANSHTAIDVSTARVYLTESVIANNQTGNLGVIHVSGADEDDDSFLYMWNNVLTSNESMSFGEAGIRVAEAELISINNIFSGHSWRVNGAVVSVIASKATFFNNVFAFNRGLEGGSVIQSEGSSQVLVGNSIFWENEAPGHPDFSIFLLDPGSISVGHSIVQKPLPSFVNDLGGVIDDDPLFVDPDGSDDTSGTLDDDFRLTGFSPAIDAGTNDLLYPDIFDLDNDLDDTEAWVTDLLGNARVFRGISGSEIVDLGPFEYGAPPAPLLIREDMIDDQSNVRITLFPNPARNRLTLNWSGGHVAAGCIKMYDLSGREVGIVFEGYLKDFHELDVDLSTLSSGAYLIREINTGITATIYVIK